MIVALVLLIRKHCLPYLQVRIIYNIRFKNENKFKQHFLLIAIGLATYFLRLQIIILMKGRGFKRSNSNNENILDELMLRFFDTFQQYT